MAVKIPTLNTKGGLKFKNVKFDGTISGTDVVNYLMNDVLQLPVKVTLQTLHGCSNGCFVITTLAIAGEDLVVSKKVNDFTTKVLDGYGHNIVNVKEDIVNKIKPFMLPTPEQFELLMRDEEQRKLLNHLGFWGNNLISVNKFSKFNPSPSTGYYVIYLDTEKIIKQMAEDPLDHKIPGEFSINHVYGETDASIRWDYTIEIGNGKRDNSSVTMDKILRNIR